MNKTNTALVSLLASSLAVSAVSAQGLLGHRYFGIDAGYERLEAFRESEDGWGTGVDLNAPITQGIGNIQADFAFEADYGRVSTGGLTIESTEIHGLVRGYRPVDQTFTPFVGGGLGWARVKASFQGFSDSDSTFVIPLEVGAELSAGPVLLTPSFRYTLALDSDADDYWTLGVSAAYWVDTTWGVTATIDHTDFDDLERLRIRGGVVLAY